MKKSTFIVGAVLLMLSFQVYPQVGINSNGDDPDESAMLDVSSSSKGFLVPRMTYLYRIRISDPAKGLLVYQTNDAEGFYYFDGTSWVFLGGGASEIDELSDGRTGGNSVFLGDDAGATDDESDNKNVAVGIESLQSNLSGFFNTALGFQALNANTKNRHTATGYQALLFNTTGESNTATGFRSSYHNTTGNYNTTVGYNSNYNNQGGSNNTIIGYLAGAGTSVHNKSGNVFLGYGAGFNETLNNKLYIENSSSNEPLVYGEFDNDILAVNGSLGVGTQSPHASAELEIESTTKGILISRMNKDQRDAIVTPATGLLIYQTDNSPGFYSYDGSQWEPMTVQGTGENEAGEAGIGSNYGTVVNNITGKVWLDRNLGASQVATSSTDAAAYGDLYQWGRSADGHELRSSGVYLEGYISDWIGDEGSNAWDGLFIFDYINWLGPPNDDLWKGVSAENNPCPCGFRLPTNAEWLQEMRTWSSQDEDGAFASPLKLTVAGLRDYDGSLVEVGVEGHYWSSTIGSTGYNGRVISFFGSVALLETDFQVYGYSVRCIKN